MSKSYGVSWEDLNTKNTQWAALDNTKRPYWTLKPSFPFKRNSDATNLADAIRDMVGHTGSVTVHTLTATKGA